MGSVLAVIDLTGPCPPPEPPLRAAAGGPPVLVLRALGLGDLLTGVPALRGLRRVFPGRPLVLAAAHPGAAWLRDLGLVDAVVPVTGTDVMSGTLCPPVLVVGEHDAVNLHGAGPQSHRLLLDGGPRRLLAYANADAGVDGPAWDATEHEVLRWCRVVASLTGASCGVDDLLLPEARASASRAAVVTAPGDDGAARRDATTPFGDDEPAARARSRWVVVHPGAASPARRWPAIRWAAVAGVLSASGRRVLVTAGPGEEAIAHEVAYRAGLRDPLAVRTGQSLPGLAAILGSASLLVSADTGVAHLANALGTPSVTIFGPTPPDRWLCLHEAARHAVVYAGDGTQRPSAPEHDGVTGPDETMLAVTADDVLTALAAVPSAAVHDARH